MVIDASWRDKLAPWLPWLKASAVAALAALLADGALALWLHGVASKVAVPEVAVESAPGSDLDSTARTPALAQLAPTRTPRSEQDYLQGILGRNLFDPTTIGVPVDLSGDAGSGVNTSPLDVTLTGTIVSVPEIYSAAFVLEKGKNSAEAYGVGQSVQGAEIVEILRDRVRLMRNGQEEWLLLSGQKEKKDEPIPSGAPNTTGDVKPTDGVVQNSETSFTLSREMVEAQLNDLNALAGMARALQHRGPDGQQDGWRLSAIRRGSLPDTIGIKNGDIVHSINGVDMSSPAAAASAYERLRSESNLQVKVTRRGQPVTLEYNIQ